MEHHTLRSSTLAASFMALFMSLAARSSFKPSLAFASDAIDSCEAHHISERKTGWVLGSQSLTFQHESCCDYSINQAFETEPIHALLRSCSAFIRGVY